MRFGGLECGSILLGYRYKWLVYYIWYGKRFWFYIIIMEIILGAWGNNGYSTVLWY